MVHSLTRLLYKRRKQYEFGESKGEKQTITQIIEEKLPKFEVIGFEIIDIDFEQNVLSGDNEVI